MKTMTKEELRSTYYGHDDILNGVYLSPLLMCGNANNGSDSMMEDTIEALIYKKINKTNVDILNDINSIAIDIDEYKINTAIEKLKRLFIYFMEKIDG